MKLYVLPVERICNASCRFCITNFRETSKKEFLDIRDLERVLAGGNWDEIFEIIKGLDEIYNVNITVWEL